MNDPGTGTRTDRLVALTLGRRRVVAAVAAAMFAALFSAGVLVEDPLEPSSTAYAFPVALLAIATGPRVGAGAGLVAGVLYSLGAVYHSTEETTWGLGYRVALLALLGFVCGALARRLLQAEQEAAARIRASEARLAEAQAIAHIGSWDWDVRADRVRWSDELHRIFGLEPGDDDLDYDTYLRLVHPEDRAAADAAVRAAFASREPFAFRHRLVRPDGEVRVVEANGAVDVENGQVVRMAGTAHDVTERVAAETEAAATRARLALAAELNDTVVQGLAVARYRLPSGSEAAATVQETLERAKALVGDLLGHEERSPGSLRRRTPAG